MEKKAEHPTRHRKVQERFAEGRLKRTFLPELTLNGRWLEQAGFTAGTETEIEVREGELVIKKKEREDGDQ